MLRAGLLIKCYYGYCGHSCVNILSHKIKNKALEYEQERRTSETVVHSTTDGLIHEDGKFMKKNIIFVIIVAIGLYGNFYFKQAGSGFTQQRASAAFDQMSKSIVSLGNEIINRGKSIAGSPPKRRHAKRQSKFNCDGRQYCSEMTSCQEAMFFLNNCPNTKMDGDRDGIPCESQWCNWWLKDERDDERGQWWEARCTSKMRGVKSLILTNDRQLSWKQIVSLIVRQLKIQYPGVFYHVTSRGNERQDIYKDKEDYKLFIEKLSEFLDVYNVSLLCYVRMTNHFHFLLTTPDGNLSEFMRHFNIFYILYL